MLRVRIGQVNVYNTIAFSDGQCGFVGGNESNSPSVSFSLYTIGNGFSGHSNVVPLSNFTLFAGPGEYHLARQSPAINVGDPSLGDPPSETEPDAGTRVLAGGPPNNVLRNNFVGYSAFATSGAIVL